MTISELEKKLSKKLQYSGEIRVYTTKTQMKRDERPFLWFCYFNGIFLYVKGSCSLRFEVGEGLTQEDAKNNYIKKLRGKTIYICQSEIYGLDDTDCFCPKHPKFRIPKSIAA